ncbi:hypothetical protein K503DRAFT_692597 [Rhizopogon vinicolor AM-OR11-026]|uniref:Uncharacterized protein n=1 Tax=Rhizopogon vinicolor AM-OR11-026 TaxID=1314800 RepID=A0A1B7MZ29_9AGAM|nr:hypothetical protein K503DRAFT_692597 [Rhizopogon vinicolor AM-OR11-026]
MTLLLGVSLCIPFVRASLSSFNGTSILTLDVSGCPSCSNTRTMWDIIWSCVATLFACAWTAVHPNIPGVHEGKGTAMYRRICLIITALLAPEFMITWAARQFFSARQATKDFNARGYQWTATHGFFAWMGGFRLYVNGSPQVTLTPDELGYFVDSCSVDMPVLTEEDIEDRSKEDVLSKGVAILQLTWFVAQFVVRYAHNLPVTLLEINTLAVAALTCTAYALWWKKPKDVGLPYIVHWKGASPPSHLHHGYAFDIHAWNYSNSSRF